MRTIHRVSISRWFVLAGLLLLASAVSACQNSSPLPADWPVKALTLPGDAQNITTSTENIFEFYYPGLGKETDALATWTVEFTSRSAPGLVSQYIEKGIQRAGYVTELPGVSHGPRGVPLDEEVKTYFSPDGQYVVIFMSDPHLLGSDGFAHTLIVSEFPASKTEK